MTKFCQLQLTCGTKAEADKISRVLLDKHLVACIKRIPVESENWWHGKKEHSKEILLLMESKLNLFSEVEDEVAKLHSYDTFVLTAQPISKISKEAASWLRKETVNA